MLGHFLASYLFGWERNPVVHSCALLLCWFLLSLFPLFIPQMLMHVLLCPVLVQLRGPSFLSGPDSLTWKVDVLPGHDVGAASVCAGGGACAGRVLAGPSRKGCLGKLPWTWELIR